MIRLLKELCAIHGVSSYEEPACNFIMERIKPYATSVRMDALGNLIVFKKGAKTPKQSVMFSAHMDEVGFMVKQITDEGYLKFATIGGIDPRVVLGKRVVVGGSLVPGVIGLKAYHLVSAEEEKIVPTVKDMYIDIGAKNKEAAMERVSIGDFVSFDGDVCIFGDQMLKAKAIDDRVGCAVMMRMLESDLPVDCTFVFGVQEEVGLRGAFGYAFSVKPDIAVVLEGTTSADLAGVPNHKKVTTLGRGPVLGVMDNSTIYDRPLFELLRDTAKANDIPWQTKEYISGGNDAGAIQRSRNGVRMASISAPVRYLHSPAGVASVQDCEQMLQLSMHFLNALSAQL